LVEAAAKQTVRRNSLRSAKDPEPGKGKNPRIEPVNLSDELKRLFSDADRAEEGLLKETPIPIPATTQAQEPVAEQTATVAILSRRKRQRIDSASESEKKLILTAEDEEEALKNTAHQTLPQDKAVRKLAEAANNFELVDPLPSIIEMCVYSCVCVSKHKHYL
jgi:hypothetical protein